MADKPTVTAKPKSAVLPALQENFPTPEIFASEVANVVLLHGNLIITFANPRVTEAADGQPAKRQRIVAGRLVLTGVAANQLVNNIQGLAEKVKSAAAAPPKT